jgi:hypothetical protein
MSLVFEAVLVLAVVIVIGSLWRASQPRRCFLVRVVRGEPRVVSGTVTPGFLRLIREVAERNGVTAGHVAGVARGSSIGLTFSRHFSQPARQQLRNGWGVCGWRSKPRAPARRR